MTVARTRRPGHSRSMRVLLAFDKFRNSMTAREACLAAARGIGSAHPGWVAEHALLSDGGDGFCDVLTTAAQGRVVRVPVRDPLLRETKASLGLVELARVPAAVRETYGLPESGTAAIVEMAAASGLAMLAEDERDPFATSSRGTGELVRAASERGVACILMGVGGSATNDLGLGALQALGLRALDAEGEPAADVAPRNWSAIDRFTAPELAGVPRITIACDVTNPLLGPNGATAVFGPQKGLRERDRPELERETERCARLLCHAFDKPDHLMERPGAGAAGGIAFAFEVALDARRVPGFDFVAAWTNLDDAIAAADIVVTGEGRFDAQSLGGKGPGRVVQTALQRGKRVVVAAGGFDKKARESLVRRGVTAIRVGGDAPMEELLRNGAANLEKAMANLA